MKVTDHGLHLSNWLRFLLPAVLVVSLGSITTVSGQDVSTSFEGDAPNFGDFTLGTPPKTVTFTGGFTQTQGILSLYRTGSKSFMALSGDTATITFERAAESVTLYLRDQSNQSLLTAFDQDNQVIDTLNGTTAGFTKFEILASSGVLVGSMTLQNPGGGMAVIDDFSFTAGPLQPEDGTQKWAFPTLGLVDSSPAIGADGTLYVGSGDGNLYAINPDGTQEWAFPAGVIGGFLASHPQR